MKKNIYIVIIFFLSSIFSYGQELTSIGVAHLKSDFSLPKVIDTQVKGKIKRALSLNGLSDAKQPSLVLVPEIMIVSENMLYGVPAYFEVEYDIVFYLQSLYGNNSFDSYTYSVKGKGRNKNNAIAKSMKKVRLNTPKFSQFLQKAQKKAIAYYEKKLPYIIQKANTAINVKEYDKALFILSDVPESIPSYSSQVLPLIEKAYQMYAKNNADAILQKAKALWAANKSDINAYRVAELIATIPTGTQAYQEAKTLIEDLENHTTDKEKLNEKIRLQKINQGHKERMAYIAAAKEVGIAYGKNSSNTNKIILWK